MRLHHGHGPDSGHIAIESISIMGYSPGARDLFTHPAWDPEAAGEAPPR